MTKRPGNLLLGLGVAALALLPGAASAQSLIDATDPELLLDFLDDSGYEVELGVDEYGDPMITGTVSDSTFTLYFYGCTASNNNCTILQFAHAWNLVEEVTLETINAWNVDRLWGQAYLPDEGYVSLSFAFNMEGGVSEENLVSTVAIWEGTLVAFEEFIGWTAAASTGKPGK